MPDPTQPDARPPELTPAEITSIREAGRAWAEPWSQNGDTLNVAPDLDLIEERGRPGSRYVRVVKSKKDFEKLGPGWIQALRGATTPKSGFGRSRQRLREAVLGHPLATRQLAHERLTKIKALAVLSSDALS